MATATYQLLADWGRDDTYDHRLADLVPYLIGAVSWSMGMPDSYADFASPARLSFTLNNVNNDFSQDDTSAAFYGLVKRGVLVKLQAVFQATTHTLFEGKITNMRFMPGERRARTVQVVVEDPMLELLDAEYQPPLQSSVTVDQVLDDFFDGGPIIFPYNSSYWVLGAATLEETTKLYGAALMNLTNFDTGAETLDYVGDAMDRGPGVSAQGFLRETINGELGGRFWWCGRTRKFRFTHRRTDPQNGTIDATYTQDDILDGDYRVGEDLLNSIVVNFAPRNVADSATAIWTSAQTPFTIAGGATQVFYPKFRDTSNEDSLIGADGAIAPVLGTDLVAQNASAEDRSTKFRVNTTMGAQGARLRITNTVTETLTVTTLKIRGEAITSYDKNYVKIRDAASVNSDDLREAAFEARLVTNDTRATQYAKHLLAIYKSLYTRFASIRIGGNKSAAILADVLTLTVGNKITVRDDWIGHNQDYIIVGEQHTVDTAPPTGENLHTTRWILRPAQRVAGWILGTSKLEVDTELVF